jgi:predicted RND superfamily exporter protein
MRERLYDTLAGLTFRRPWIVFTAALLVSVAGGALSESLKMETRVLDLLPEDDPASTEYNDIIQQYSSASQIIVGIEGEDRQQMIAFAETLEKRIGEVQYENGRGEKHPFIKRITIRLDEEFITEHGLMLAKQSDLENFDELFQKLELAPLLAAYNDFFEREYVEDTGSVTEREKEDNAINGLKNLLAWLQGVEKAAAGGEQLQVQAERAADLLSVGEPYFFSDDNRMMLVMVLPAISMDRMEEVLSGVESFERLIDDIEQGFPGVRVRTTGMPVLGYDEMQVVNEDMAGSLAVSFALVLAIFILAFRMWTAPLLAMVTLGMGIVWTTGFIALSFGRLNLFTLMFGVILVGLGIDFSIHLNSAFSTARSEGMDLATALREMYRRAGNGVLTGAVTTSAAFIALAFTGLQAFIELGVVLGAGIVLTMIASMTVLPAMFTIHERLATRFSGGKPRQPGPVRLAVPFLAATGQAVQKRPWPVLALMVLLTGVFSWASLHAEFEKDMLEMEPEDMQSVLLHKDILKRFELHPDFSMITTDDLDRTRRIVDRVKKNRLVGRVDAVTEFLPSEKQQKKRARLVKRIGDRMRALAEPQVVTGLPGGTAVLIPPQHELPDRVTDEEVEQFLSELDRLQMNVQEIGTLAFASLKERLRSVCDRLGGGENKKASKILGLKKRLTANQSLAAAMGAYQQAYVPLLAGRLARMANTSPITLDTLPESIKERYLSKEGKNLITIYSSVDLWHEDKLDLFLKAMHRVADRFTGTVVLMEKLIDLISDEGLKATLLALGAVLVLLFIDFRHPGYVVLGALPLLTGFAWMMGLFVLVGKKFDVVNVEAIPLILGIGIDDAVHVLHAVKRQGVRAVPEVLRHTGRALFLTTLTTAIAFGSIAFSAHRGMAGMGILLVLGVWSCLVTSLVLLPALMKIFFKEKESKK